MTWLLAQGEHLPVILVAIVLTIGICRIMFASRGDLQAMQARIDDLAKSDEHHMSAVGRAHQRVDDWIGAIHADLVRLYELAHDHAHRKDGDKENTS
jgi:hypothetical protein